MFNLYVTLHLTLQFSNSNNLLLDILRKNTALSLSRAQRYPSRILQMSWAVPISEVLWWGRMASQIVAHSSLIAKNQWPSCKSLGSAHFSSSTVLSWSVQFYTSTSNRRSGGEYMTQPGICPHFSLKCANTITLGLSKVVWRRFAASSLSSPLARHAIKTRQAAGTEGARRRCVAEGKSDGNGTDVCAAADLWCDKGAAQAAGIDGLLVGTGPLCELFSKWLIYNKVAPGVCMRAELMQIDPTEIDWSAI